MVDVGTGLQDQWWQGALGANAKEFKLRHRAYKLPHAPNLLAQDFKLPDQRAAVADATEPFKNQILGSPQIREQLGVRFRAVIQQHKHLHPHRAEGVFE